MESVDKKSQRNSKIKSNQNLSNKRNKRRKYNQN